MSGILTQPGGVSPTRRWCAGRGCPSVLCGLTFLGLFLCAPCFAEEQPSAAEETDSSSSAPASYCGVHSLYRAARALGVELRFRDLLKPEYISDRAGSSIQDLIRAANELDLHARPLQRMTCPMLDETDVPVILHIKSSVGSRVYDHWVLYMGTENGQARIYDGSAPLALMDFRELAARWDGIGLLLSERRISTFPFWITALSQLFFYAGLLALLLTTTVLAVGSFRRWGLSGAPGPSNWWPGVLWEVCGIVLAACLLGGAYRLIQPEGFLSYPAAVTEVQDAHLAGFLTKVSAKEAARLLATNITVVDARPAADFVSGHLDGARNIPPNSLEAHCEMVLADVSREDPILIYCSSNGCHYSQDVARKLRSLGYRNITLFPDGWLGWQQYTRQEEGS